MRTEVKVKANSDGTLERSVVDNSMVYATRTDCRACHGEVLQDVIHLGTQYLVNFVPDIDVSLPKAPLNLVRCDKCGLLQLRHTVNPDLLFRDFWYRSGINQSMRDALADIVTSVEGMSPKEDGVWLDIGANDGYLLTKVPDTYMRIACEPARTFTAELRKISDHVIADYFSASHDALYSAKGKGRCDVITSAAMFYDVDDPDAFVADIARVLSPDGIWVNQLNDSPTMLQRNAFDAICHEHLCYYDVHSLKNLYARHGLAIIKVTHNEVNGGSIRVYATKARAGVKGIPLIGFKACSLADCLRFADRVRKWKVRFTDMLRGAMAMHGPIWLYGASTKGAVLLQYLESAAHFAGIADRNPTKHGLMMAGTWLKVLPEDEMRAQSPRYVIALPWAFRDEFVVREREMLDNGTAMVFPLPNIEFVL
jgi:NDP-4-keto-2,6-dideoxyhexose 3-C-methyltransferase